MLGAVAGIEETSLNGDEGVVVVTVGRGLCEQLLVEDCRKNRGCEGRHSREWISSVPLQPSSSVAIYDGNGLWIGNRDMIRLYAHQGPQPLVGLVHG